MVLHEIGDFMYDRWRDYRDIPAVNAAVNTGLFYGAAKVGARILGATTDSYYGLEDFLDVLAVPLGTGFVAAAQSDKVTPNRHIQDVIKAGIGAATLGTVGYNLTHYQGHLGLSDVGHFLQRAFDSPTIALAVTGALLFSGVRVAQGVYQRHKNYIAAHPAGTP